MRSESNTNNAVKIKLASKPRKKLIVSATYKLQPNDLFNNVSAIASTNNATAPALI